MAGDIYNTVPNTQIADFLAAYGVDYSSDDKEQFNQNLKKMNMKSECGRVIKRLLFLSKMT